MLLLAGIIAFILVRVSGRQPVAKISAMRPVRENIVSSVSSNGKVEPIAPFSIRAQLDTFVEKVHVSEGQNVKKGQLLLELNVKEAASQLAQAKSRLLRAEDDLRSAKAGGRADEAARVSGDLPKPRPTATACSEITNLWSGCLHKALPPKTNLPQMTWRCMKAQSEVSRLLAAKQEFDRQAGSRHFSRTLSVSNRRESDVAALEEKVAAGQNPRAFRWHALRHARESRRFREDRRSVDGDGRSAQGPRARFYRRAGDGRAGSRTARQDHLGRSCRIVSGRERPKSFPNRLWRAARAVLANFFVRWKTTNSNFFPTPM